MHFEKEALPTPNVCDAFDDVVPLLSKGDGALDHDLDSNPLSGTVCDALQSDEGPDSDNNSPHKDSDDNDNDGLDSNDDDVN